ncbi:MAG: uroporphyrinogen-III C-methyltransferase [Nitrospiraceae bacterium]
MLPTNFTTPAFDAGTVWLVGAGPGDPGLLTLHAAHALMQADVVLHDALIAPEILSLTPPTRLVPVGKRAGGKRTHQLRINEMLIQLARRRLRVVRLKGGDPLVFGRGAEEALALAAAGIAFRIVPGISAGIGGLAAAGIPLTHRHLGRSVSFATGHDSAGGLAELDWAAFARGADVLVLYMVRNRMSEIAHRLIASGRAADEAVALIASATTAGQCVVTASLETAGIAAATLPSAAPVILVVGPVVALRSLLDSWQQTSPMTVTATPTMPEPARVKG